MLENKQVSQAEQAKGAGPADRQLFITCCNSKYVWHPSFPLYMSQPPDAAVLRHAAFIC